MLTVELSCSGEPIADVNALDTCLLWAQFGDNRILRVSTYNVIRAIQLLIVRGHVSHVNVQFSIYGTHCVANKYGAIHDQPDNADLSAEWAVDILMAAAKKRKEEQ